MSDMQAGNVETLASKGTKVMTIQERLRETTCKIDEEAADHIDALEQRVAMLEGLVREARLYVDIYREDCMSKQKEAERTLLARIDAALNPETR